MSVAQQSQSDVTSAWKQEPVYSRSRYQTKFERLQRKPVQRLSNNINILWSSCCSGKVTSKRMGSWSSLSDGSHHFPRQPWKRNQIQQLRRSLGSTFLLVNVIFRLQSPVGRPRGVQEIDPPSHPSHLENFTDTTRTTCTFVLVPIELLINPIVWRRSLSVHYSEVRSNILLRTEIEHFTQKWDRTFYSEVRSNILLRSEIEHFTQKWDRTFYSELRSNILLRSEVEHFTQKWGRTFYSEVRSNILLRSEIEHLTQKWDRTFYSEVRSNILLRSEIEHFTQKWDRTFYSEVRSNILLRTEIEQFSQNWDRTYFFPVTGCSTGYRHVEAYCEGKFRSHRYERSR